MSRCSGYYTPMHARMLVMTLYRKSFIGIGTLFLLAALVYGYSVFFTVRESDETSVTVGACAPGQKISCWLEEITQALDAGGLAAAFDTVAVLYESDSAFAADCHSFTHELGEAAYEKFSRGDELDITTKTSYCGYGFYHGFMETLLQTSGDIAEARQFCAYVDAKLSRERSGAATACYHGMGHGTVDGSDPRTWGSAEKMIAPGIEICKRVAETEFQEYLCATGVFNSIEVLARDKKYGISNLLEDPFQLCHNQPALYREPCYTNMIPAVFALAGGNFSKAAQYVEDNIQHADDFTIDGYTIREMVVLSVFHEFARGNIDTVDYAERGMALCRSVPEHSRLACVEGIADGHMKYGKPGAEYIKVFSFCADDELRADEKNICYKHILTRLSIWYSKDEQKDICNRVPMIYQKYCPL
ncbi:MAG: hypothetical protein G01um101429_944 [Parcubacteria group bacterium Gr01-1014_29]|nr:MAG: hypothetical protein G01um101429_944 [Parcubacteria group bacterium Gr01-1014_29]